MTDLLKPKWEVDYGSDPQPVWDASVLSGRAGPLQVRECRTVPRWNSQLGWTVNGVMAAELVRFFRAQRGPAAKFYFYAPSSLPWDSLAAGTGDGLTAAFPFAGREVYPGSDVVTVGGAAKVNGTDYFFGYENRLLFSEDPRMVTGLTNLLTANQSSVETDTTGFTVLSTETISQSATYARFGTKSLKVITPNAAVNEGIYTTSTVVTASLTYTASVWARGSGTVAIQFDERTAGDGYIGGTVSTALALTDRWQRIVVSRAFGATGVKARINVYTTVQAGVTFYVDGLQLVQSSLPGAWAVGGTAATAGWICYSGTTAVMTPGQAAPSGPATATRIQTSGGTDVVKFEQFMGYSPALGTMFYTEVWVKNPGAKDVTVLCYTTGLSRVVPAGAGWTLVQLGPGPSRGTPYDYAFLRFCAPAAGDSLDFQVWHPWQAWYDANLGDPTTAWGYIPTQETAITADSLGRQRVAFVEGSVPVSAAAVVMSYRGQRLLLGRCTSDIVPKTVDADVFSIAAAFTGEEV